MQPETLMDGAGRTADADTGPSTDTKTRLDECLGQIGDHLRRGVVEMVSTPHQARVDVVTAQRR